MIRWSLPEAISVDLICFFFVAVIEGEVRPEVVIGVRDMHLICETTLKLLDMLTTSSSKVGSDHDEANTSFSHHRQRLLDAALRKIFTGPICAPFFIFPPTHFSRPSEPVLTLSTSIPRGALDLPPQPQFIFGFHFVFNLTKKQVTISWLMARECSLFLQPIRYFGWWAVDLIDVFLRWGGRVGEDVYKMTWQSVSGPQVHTVVSINSQVDIGRRHSTKADGLVRKNIILVSLIA
jgi:hypothetical protein